MITYCAEHLKIKIKKKKIVPSTLRTNEMKEATYLLNFSLPATWEEKEKLLES